MARHLISSDLAIKAIKPGDTRSRLSDGDGLYLRLFVKGGSHGWRFDYSFGGARKGLSLGTYPDTTLAAARRKAQEARELIANGVDPSAERKSMKAARLAQQEVEERAEAGLPALNSFEAIAREWIAKVHAVKNSTGHAARTLIRLEQDVFPWMGRRPIAEIDAPELLRCLSRIEARGAIETAHRAKYMCGQVFRYAIGVGKCKRDPSCDISDALTPVRVKHYAAITEPKRAGELLRALAAYKGHPVTRAALALAPLLFQRPGELRKAEWSEIDLEAGMWTIPSWRMKGRKVRKESGVPHLVPLSAQAVALLRDLQPLTGHGRYVFPSLRTTERPMSDAAVLAALRRMGFPKDEMTGHGFRAMARTMLAERLGVADAVIEAQPAHDVPDALGRAYNRTEFIEQRRLMMQRWADYIDQLRRGGEVIPLRQQGA